MLTRRQRYKLARYLPSFLAIQGLYLVHRQNQIAEFYKDVDPSLWFMV